MTGIADIITTPGLINVDFADVKTVMKEAGTALLAELFIIYYVFY